MRERRVFYSPTPSPLALPLPLPSTPNNGASTNDLDCGQFYPGGVGGIRGGEGAGKRKQDRNKKRERTSEQTNKQTSKRKNREEREGGRRTKASTFTAAIRRRDSACEN
jgi:hypothetical protein